jgi:hypothetical protein
MDGEEMIDKIHEGGRLSSHLIVDCGFSQACSRKKRSDRQVRLG